MRTASEWSWDRDVAIATITWARSPSEEGFLRHCLRSLSDTALPVAVGDANTSSTFRQFLETLHGFSVGFPTERGLVNQVKTSFELASRFGTEFVLYTEPDKKLFFTEHVKDFLRLALQRSAGVAIAARSAASFETFPPIQRYTEGVINRLCSDTIGIAGDYSYGPFLVNRALLPFLARVDERLGWGWRHYMFRSAHRQGLRVIHIEGDFQCPMDQRSEDDRDRAHRIVQLSQNLVGLIE
jgi:hypothetical protein